MTGFSFKVFRWYLLFALLGANFFIWYVVQAEGKHELTISFLDVGQGDAILIEAPNGNQLLIDAGPDAHVLSSLGEALPFYDRSLDGILATHPDKDHIGGFISVMDSYSIENYFNSGKKANTELFLALEKSIKEKEITNSKLSRGMRLHLGEGAYADVLWPTSDAAQLEKLPTNETSITLRVVYGATSFLFSGDAGIGVESKLIAMGKKDLDVDVVKLGHHGSRTSSLPGFLTAASPELAVISAGKDNRYGHPHPQVLERLTALKIPYESTYEEGTITLKSDGEKIYK